MCNEAQLAKYMERLDQHIIVNDQFQERVETMFSSIQEGTTDTKVESVELKTMMKERFRVADEQKETFNKQQEDFRKKQNDDKEAILKEVRDVKRHNGNGTSINGRSISNRMLLTWMSIITLGSGAGGGGVATLLEKLAGS